MTTVTLIGGVVTGIIIGWIGVSILTAAIFNSRVRRIRKAVSHRLTELSPNDHFQ